jgi:predicted HicB family RNase H-like nuclease
MPEQDLNEQLAEILQRPYMKVFVREGDYYTAEIIEFPGCIAEGKTLKGALNKLEDVTESWVLSCLETGKNIPEPLNLNASGKILFRMPKEMHKRLVKRAALEKTSINTLICMCIAEKLGMEVDNDT